MMMRAGDVRLHCPVILMCAQNLHCTYTVRRYSTEYSTPYSSRAREERGSAPDVKKAKELRA